MRNAEVENRAGGVGVGEGVEASLTGTEVRFRIWQYDLGLGLSALFFAGMVVLAVVTADTTGGQVAGGLVMGTGFVVCLGAWVNIRLHPAQLFVDVDMITLGVRGRPQTISLYRHLSDELAFILVRYGRGAHWNLVQAGSTTQLDVQGFKKSDVEAACRAYEWRFAE